MHVLIIATAAMLYLTCVVSAAVHTSRGLWSKSTFAKAKEGGAFRSFQKNLKHLNFYVQQKTQKKRQKCSSWASLWDRHHTIQIISSWSRLKLPSAPRTIPGSERKRGRKQKRPTLELAQWSGERNAKLAPWAQLPRSLPRSSGVCSCDGGACTRLLRPLPVAAGNRTTFQSQSVCIRMN